MRTVFDKLQFRTLLERVLKVAAAAGEAVNGLAVESLTTTDDASVPAVVPPVRTWSTRNSRSGSSRPAPRVDPLALQLEFGPDGLSGFGLATADDTAYVPVGARHAGPRRSAKWLAAAPRST